MLEDKSILITGGTGSFGTKCVELILKEFRPKRLAIFSRDELKQFEMAQTFPQEQHSCLRYFIGDVRDQERLRRALTGVDVVIHAAALKQVPAAEYNPFEAVKTNILGAQNIVDAAIDAGVRRVIALSTDKAANPINLYGATKLCSDKLFIAGNAYAGKVNARFSVVRYGNVMASRGSVIPFFLKKRETGVLPITHPDMTRFWITLEQGVRFVLKSLKHMRGGEIFVPKIPSMKITELAKAICPDCEHEVVGVRPGEKIHETMIPVYEARNTFEFDTHFVIQPTHRFFERETNGCGGREVGENFEYSSNTNDSWLDHEDLRRMLNLP